MQVSGHHGRGALGFGGAVGVGVGVALLIAVIATGRALGRQLTGAMSVVIVFAEVAACTILGVITVAVLGLLAYRGQLARLHLAERRAEVARLERGPSWRAEVLEGGESEVLPQAARPVVLGKRPMTVTRRRLEAVPEPGDQDGA
jgi:hypothetical protein